MRGTETEPRRQRERHLLIESNQQQTRGASTKCPNSGAGVKKAPATRPRGDKRVDSDLAKVRPLIPANTHPITGNFEEKENSQGAETPRQPTRPETARERREGRVEISPMKTVQPGFLAMGAGSGRRRRRDSGKEAALTPRRTRGVQTGKVGETSNRSDWQGRQARRAHGAREVGRGGDTVPFRVICLRGGAICGGGSPADAVTAEDP
jgi:hypothetical protein